MHETGLLGDVMRKAEEAAAGRAVTGLRLRVGVLIGRPAALDPVRAVTLPFNVNAVAIAATLAALANRP